MSSRLILSLLAATLLWVSCQSNINQPNEPLTYNGIIVSETPPAFNGTGGLAKSTLPNAQVESAPPYGTVYGHENDPDNVYLCQGGETLTDGSWTDQVYNDTYKTTLFENSVAEFDGVVIVTITNPENCYYVDNNGNWVQVTSDINVQTTAVSTGPNGSADIESSTICSIGNGGF